MTSARKPYTFQSLLKNITLLPFGLTMRELSSDLQLICLFNFSRLLLVTLFFVVNIS